MWLLTVLYLERKVIMVSTHSCAAAHKVVLTVDAQERMALHVFTYMTCLDKGQLALLTHT